MAQNEQDKSKCRPAGYAALIERYDLDVIPNWHKSLVATSGIQRVNSNEGIIEEVYPAKYWPESTLGGHLEFALKYDGTNLSILSVLYHKIAPEDLVAHIRSKPTGKYARRLWFLYEFLTGRTLQIADLTQGNYIDLLESDEYYAVKPVCRVRRQRVNNNLPGNHRFCPMVRRTNTLGDFKNADLSGKFRQLVAGYPPELLKNTNPTRVLAFSSL